jgi:predicted metal-dependent hydrolase
MYKAFALDERTNVTVYKRKASRSLRLTITAKGDVRVSIPYWVSYDEGVKFAKSRLHWIEAQRPDTSQLTHGQRIGKAHHLRLLPLGIVVKTSARVYDTEIIVKYPSHLTASSEEVQKAAQDASIKALRKQAEQLLPGRLSNLAEKHGFSYGHVQVKLLKSRWGSCDHERNITLNLYLMQLPWELIDYVLLHELTHTEIMRHGPDFWNAMRRVLPNLQSIRKQMRTHHPVLS